LTDPHSEIANNQTADGYNIFNLIASTRPLYSNEHFVSSEGAITGSSYLYFVILYFKKDTFLVAICSNLCQKRIAPQTYCLKINAARYCALTACRSRMLVLTDSHATIASSQTVGSYGIFNLVLSTTRINRNN
jgi:hypothetical protein